MAPSGPSVAACDAAGRDRDRDGQTEAARREPAAAEPFPRSEPSAPVSAIDQEEMRDRIAATCARLKAKAFDAMARETALLSHDDGGDAGRLGGRRLGGNLECMVDEAFSEEEA